MAHTASASLTSTNSINVTITDPRPDLSADSELWTRLLSLSAQPQRCCPEQRYPEHNCLELPELTKSLLIMRQNGTRLKKLDSGDYGLRPQIRKSKGGKSQKGQGCWKDAAAYRQMAAELLKPHHEQLVELLKEFTAAITSEINSMPEWEKVQHALSEHGICAIFSEVLNENVYFAQDQQIAAGAPKSAVVYTLDELRLLLANPPPNENELKKIHEIKKVFNGTILEAGKEMIR